MTLKMTIDGVFYQCLRALMSKLNRTNSRKCATAGPAIGCSSTMYPFIGSLQITRRRYSVTAYVSDAQTKSHLRSSYQICLNSQQRAVEKAFPRKSLKYLPKTKEVYRIMLILRYRSRIVEDTRSLESGPSTTVLFYYFDHADQRTLEFEIFLNTILKQFLVLGQISPELVLKFIHTYRNVSAKPGENDLVETICSMIESCGEVCLIVDGLDECEKQVQREILAFLDRLSRLQAPVVKIFVSCREETHLLQALSPYPRIHLSPTTLSSDIKSFVQGTVRSRITSGELQVKGLNLEREITTELISKAQGM